MAAERRARREVAHEANRLAMAVTSVQTGGEQPPIYIDSDESDVGSCSQGRRTSSRKRKLEDSCEEVETGEEMKMKQGRPTEPVTRCPPPTTGLYVGRAKAIAAYNKEKKEAAALDDERILRSMSSGQIFSRMETDLYDAVTEMSYAPTSDIAHRARECMAEVVRVAKCSRNLTGGFVRILKHAAVVGSASTEVLRTRADTESGSESNDALNQLKALKRELELVKREARQAREEAEKAKAEAEQLRKELTEVKGEKRTRGRRRTYFEDSSPSPPPLPVREQAIRDAGQAELADTRATRMEESPMDVEIAAVEETAAEEEAVQEAVPEKEPKYCDARRKKEILPPPEEWPAAVRPALQGKVKILEDRPLTGHKVRLVDERKKKKEEKQSPIAGVVEEEKGGAQLLVEQITPLLQKWLEENLKSMGFSKKPSGRDAVATTAKRQPNAGQKVSQKAEKPTRPQTKGPEGARSEVVQSTIEPNTALWSKVVGRKAALSAFPPPPAVQQQPKDKPSAAGPSKAADSGA